jgi:hypothetical protein
LVLLRVLLGPPRLLLLQKQLLGPMELHLHGVSCRAWGLLWEQTALLQHQGLLLLS